jgi:transcriptional regulator with XRE-family HTH domain
MPKNANIIGRNVAKFRYQAGWTQEFLAVRMQLLGCYINRDIIANIETHSSPWYLESHCIAFSRRV